MLRSDSSVCDRHATERLDIDYYHYWGNSWEDYLLDTPPVHNSIGAFTLPYSQIHCILYSVGTPLLCTGARNDADQ